MGFFLSKYRRYEKKVAYQLVLLAVLSLYSYDESSYLSFINLSRYCP